MITELHILLLSLVGVVLSGVWVLGLFREWRFRRQARSSFAFRAQDVLMNCPKSSVRDVSPEHLQHPCVQTLSDRENRAFSQETTRKSGETQASASSEENTAVVHRSEAEQGMLYDEQILVQSLLDPKIDFIAELQLRQPYTFEDAPSLKLPRRHQVLAYSQAKEWHLGVPLHTPINALRLGMQMVDRSGAMTAGELQSFCRFVSGFAERHDASCTFPQRDMKLAEAQRLDRFCVDVDILMTLHMVSGDPVSFVTVEDFARSQSMTLEQDGYFHRKSDLGQTLFTLGSVGGRQFTRDVQTSLYHTIMFDVPRAVGGLEVFERVRACCHAFVQATGSVVMDEAGQALTEEGFLAIRAQLEQVYVHMDREHILPGSITALRLFA